jgi:IS1 family transposase
VTAVERETLCVVSYAVLWHRSFEQMQQVADDAPIADRYFSDGLQVYAQLYWHEGVYQALKDKSQTFSVEGDNAQLRQYLARLARQSRCFSRSIHALRRAVDLFVYYGNQRQRHESPPSTRATSGNSFTL